jgi:hypothetical protein
MIIRVIAITDADMGRATEKHYRQREGCGHKKRPKPSY